MRAWSLKKEEMVLRKTAIYPVKMFLIAVFLLFDVLLP
jgi:hypothetical protein